MQKKDLWLKKRSTFQQWPLTPSQSIVECFSQRSDQSFGNTWNQCSQMHLIWLRFSKSEKKNQSRKTLQHAFLASIAVATWQKCEIIKWVWILLQDTPYLKKMHLEESCYFRNKVIQNVLKNASQKYEPTCKDIFQLYHLVCWVYPWLVTCLSFIFLRGHPSSFVSQLLRFWHMIN